MEEIEDVESISTNISANFSAKEWYVDYILCPKEELVMLVKGCHKNSYCQ